MLGTPNVELVLVGEGPLRPRLEARAAALGLGSRVRFAGFAEDVTIWLRKADLLALTSDYEGLPAVAVEALACGVPVVATYCFDEAAALLGAAPGCRVVPRGNAAAIAGAIASALAAPRNPEALRTLARPYLVDTALRDHVSAVFALAASPPERLSSPGRRTC